MTDELGTERLEHLGYPLENEKRHNRLDNHLDYQRPQQVRKDHHHHLIQSVQDHTTHDEPPHLVQELGHDLHTIRKVRQDTL